MDDAEEGGGDKGEEGNFVVDNVTEMEEEEAGDEDDGDDGDNGTDDDEDNDGVGDDAGNSTFCFFGKLSGEFGRAASIGRIFPEGLRSPGPLTPSIGMRVR